MGCLCGARELATPPMLWVSSTAKDHKAAEFLFVHKPAAAAPFSTLPPLFGQAVNSSFLLLGFVRNPYQRLTIFFDDSRMVEFIFPCFLSTHQKTHKHSSLLSWRTILQNLQAFFALVIRLFCGSWMSKRTFEKAVFDWRFSSLDF